MGVPLSLASEKGLYDGAERYILSNERVSWRDFDKSVLDDLRLFDTPDDNFLDSVEETLDSIIRALPHFERIFVRPIIRLKDEHRIVPIEAVKVIDNRSLTHLASRCELWEDITKNGIKPRKLMTVENVETYSIYENVVFACAVDTVLAYIKQNTLIMKDVFYGCKDIHFNLLDRTHHSSYFLAIGKLYLEYVRSGVSLERWARCMDKMLHIEKTLRRRLNSPVYRQCKKSAYNIKLKKTNIFRSHKDYKEIFRIMSLFKMLDEDDEDEGALRRLLGEKEKYKSFCRLITVFAAGHFNYSFDEGSLIELKNLKFDCSYLDWHLRVREISENGIDAIVFETEKESRYVTTVIFGEKKEYTQSLLDEFAATHRSDELLFCNTSVFGDRTTLYLSILDVDSFRRVQQILLRGMIYSDTKKDRCAFCSGICEIKDGRHICRSCQAEVYERECPTVGKRYFVSTLIRKPSGLGVDKQVTERRRFLHDRYDEAQLHFRNITPIDKSGEHICPFCGTQHAD